MTFKNNGKVGKNGIFNIPKIPKIPRFTTQKKGIIDMENITDIKRTLLILKNHGVNKINIRCIGKSQTKNEIFSTTEADEILKYIKRLEKDFNIYTTFNCFDTVEKNTVSDKDIKKIKFILL